MVFKGKYVFGRSVLGKKSMGYLWTDRNINFDSFFSDHLVWPLSRQGSQQLRRDLESRYPPPPSTRRRPPPPESLHLKSVQTTSSLHTRRLRNRSLGTQRLVSKRRRRKSPLELPGKLFYELHALWNIRVWNIRVSTQKWKIIKGHESLFWKF